MQRMLSMKINDDTLAKLVIHAHAGDVLELRAHRPATDVEADRHAGVRPPPPRSGPSAGRRGGGWP